MNKKNRKFVKNIRFLVYGLFYVCDVNLLLTVFLF